MYFSTSDRFYKKPQLSKKYQFKSIEKIIVLALFMKINQFAYLFIVRH